MSTWVDRVLARVRRAAESDDGFTLIEMVVALMVFALVAQGLAGVLISGANAEVFAQRNTGAKNFAQQRIDAMRSLPYHVDVQNGDYIDLLDLYFANSVATATPIEHIVSGGAVQGVFVASDVKTSRHPAGPYYKVTIPGTLAGTPQLDPYTQTVYTQFLNSSDPTSGALPTVPGTYDNTVPGADQPVSPIVGVTVDTSWTSGGQSHVLTTYTQIASQGTDTSLVVSQAKAAALRVLTQDDQFNAITATVGSVVANGSVATGSQAGAQATGASVEYTNETTWGDPTTAIAAQVIGEQASTSSPPNPGGSTGTSGPLGPQGVGSGGCGTGWWAAFGTTEAHNVSSTTANGLPLVPSLATASLTSSPTVTASLDAPGGAPGCSGLWFSNQRDTIHLPDPALSLGANQPMVQVADLSGSAPEISGGARLYASPQASVDDSVVASASSWSSTWVKVFPSVTLTPALPGSAPDVAGTPGLVNVQLSNALLACETQADGSTKATLTYSGEIVWYTYNTSTHAGAWRTLHFSWAAGQGDPLSSVDLSAPVSSNGKTLSNYFTTVSGATGVVGANGVENVEAAVSIATVPTLGAAFPGTTLDVELGHLSCAASDHR